LEVPYLIKLLTPAVAVIAVAFAAAILTASHTPTSSAAPALDSEEQAFVNLINNYRAQNGKAPLALNTDLNEAADWMSNDMGVHSYFEHIDSLGRNPTERMCHFGYCYDTWKGENISAGFATAAEVFNAWKLSPKHNENMLQPAYKVMGVGRIYVSGSIYGWYWTNDFAGYLPASGQPTATPSPAPTTCAGDSDCDKWSDTVESSLGTNRTDACSNTTARNDEHPDAWPPDLNDDRIVNSLDAGVFTPRLNARRGQQDFSARLDLNVDGVINTTDIGLLTLVLNDTC
jgi:uncharacterized protein YkwD